MTTIEKAYKIRNLWNRWYDYGKKEFVLASKISKADEELKKATYSKNGYSHFKVFDSWLNKEEAIRQRSYLIEEHEIVVNHILSIESLLEQLINTSEKKGL